MVRALLKDDRLWRTHADPERAARVSTTSIFGGAQPSTPTEVTDHARMRRSLAPLFSDRRMAEMRPYLTELVDRLINDVERAGSPADLHDLLSTPLHVHAAGKLLGVPEDDHAKVREWSNEVAVLDDAERSMAGWSALWEYMLALVERKKSAPERDALSEMTQAYADVEDGHQKVAEYAAELFAGHSTVIAAIDEGIVMLLSDRARWDVLRNEHELLPSAVEEILRLCLPVPGVAEQNGQGTGLPRWAKADIDVDDITIRQGDLVLFDLRAANHDAGRFPAPEIFDPARPNNTHLTFGHGPALCIGRPLARIELNAVFGALPARLPDLHLAVDPSTLLHRDDSVVGGLVELPVSWQ